jgi:hypothetical protein
VQTQGNCGSIIGAHCLQASAIAMYLALTAPDSAFISSYWRLIELGHWRGLLAGSSTAAAKRSQFTPGDC